MMAIGEGCKNPLLTMSTLAQLGEFPNPAISFATVSNKRLSLPTAGIVSAAVSSKTGFAEWHASRGGWVTFA